MLKDLLLQPQEGTVVPKWEPSGMTEEKKQALRNSFAGKAVSEMTAEERKVFDQDFQYGFGKKLAKNLAVVKSTPPIRSKTSTLTVLKLTSFVRGK